MTPGLCCSSHAVSLSTRPRSLAVRTGLRAGIHRFQPMNLRRQTGLYWRPNGKRTRLSASEDSPRTRPGRPGPNQAPSTIVLVMSGPVAHRDVVTLCERVSTLLESCDDDLVICDVGVLDEPDAL